MLKKISFFRILSVTIFAAMLLSSCKSSETNTAPEPVTSLYVRDEGTSPVLTPSNEHVGGILLENSFVTAQTAAPMPVGGEMTQESGTDPQDAETGPDAQPQTSADTTVTTTAASASSSAQTTAAQTSAVTTTTTAAATTTSATTAATTTTAVTTSASAATTTTTAAAPAPVSAYTGGSYAKNSYSALNHSRVKAVWISYIEMSALLSGKSEADFRSTFGKMLDNCASVGLNTVFVHVRAFGDAFYFSELFPFTDSLGAKTSYDPLKIMVSEAHSRNISLHAWINPMRLCSDAKLAGVSSKYPVGKWYNGAEKGTYIVNVGGTWYLNPAYEAVRELISDNVREIVSNYNVDGIHIDDYFYPTTDASFDSSAFASSGYSTLFSFRTANINAMVKGMYSAAHECGSAVFGAAPQGNNYNNLYALYADANAWCKGGYVDYFAPQIYYGFENSALPFKQNVDEWLGIVKGTGTKLYPGLALYKIGKEDTWAGTGKTEWQNTTTMIKRQIEYAEENGCGGVALYSYNYLFNDTYRTSAVKAEIENFTPLLTK